MILCETFQHLPAFSSTVINLSKIATIAGSTPCNGFGATGRGCACLLLLGCLWLCSMAAPPPLPPPPPPTPLPPPPPGFPPPPGGLVDYFPVHLVVWVVGLLLQDPYQGGLLVVALHLLQVLILLDLVGMGPLLFGGLVVVLLHLQDLHPVGLLDLAGVLVGV